MGRLSPAERSGDCFCACGDQAACNAPCRGIKRRMFPHAPPTTRLPRRQLFATAGPLSLLRSPTWPTRRLLEVVPGFSCSISFTSTPYVRAKALKVSPDLTVAEHTSIPHGTVMFCAGQRVPGCLRRLCVLPAWQGAVWDRPGTVCGSARREHLPGQAGGSRAQPPG